MIGIMLDGLWPPRPWQALQASALAAPGASSGPAAAGPLASTTLRLSEPPMRRKIVRIGRSLLPVGGGLEGPSEADADPRLRELVLPDAGRPADCVLSPLGLAPGRELLLELGDLAARDLGRVAGG